MVHVSTLGLPVVSLNKTRGKSFVSASSFLGQNLSWVGTQTEESLLKCVYANLYSRQMSMISHPIHLVRHRFLSFEVVLGTFLHELVHNSIDRHGKRFDTKLSEIRVQCENAMLERIKIAFIPRCGFLAGGKTEDMSQFSKRELSLFAAETRLALGVSVSERTKDEDIEVIELE